MQVYPCEEVLSFRVAVWSLNVRQSVSVSQMCETTDYSSRNLVIVEACKLARVSNVARLKEEGGEALCFCLIQVLCPPTRLKGIYTVVKICPVSFRVPP